jgi:membrane fusion protein (multidrug efflux system)
MSRTQRRWALPALGATLGSILVASAALLMGGPASAEKTPTPEVLPPLVSVATLEPQAVSSVRTFSGRAESARRVEVRARVQGILETRLYREGAAVDAGEQLFQIEPDRFAVQVQRAEAELSRAAAELNKARRDWKRIEQLFQSKTVSERDRDHARSALELAEADVAVARAALNDARIQFGYTAVTAPIAGITSQEVLSEGNLVQAQTLLTTIEQLDPIHVQFSISEQDALALKRARTAGERANVMLLLADGSTYERPGEIDFAGATIDAGTGTVQARAVVPNPDGLIMPGQFLRVSLDRAAASTELVVPPHAVAQGSGGPVVYVVDDQQRAEERAVVLGPTVAEGVVIRSGVKAGERVVVDGIARLEPNGKVRIADGGPDGGPAHASAAAFDSGRRDA